MLVAHCDYYSRELLGGGGRMFLTVACAGAAFLSGSDSEDDRERLKSPARMISGGSRARAGTRTALEPRITGCEPDRQMESTADPRRDDEPVGAERTPADRGSRAAAANPTIEILGYAVSWRAAAAAVLTLAAVMFFARLGARALWSSEFRWAEIAREMHLTGRYFWPTINGRVYYDKPLGSYWLVMAADLADRRTRRDFGAAPVRDRRSARRVAGDAGRAAALR